MNQRLYKKLEKRKENGEELSVYDLTEEDWKQLTIKEHIGKSSLNMLFKEKLSTIMSVRKRMIGRVIKDYIEDIYFYDIILTSVKDLYNYDLSILCLTYLNTTGCKEVYYNDPKNPYEYKCLFKVKEELNNQILIAEQNVSGSIHQDTLFDTYIEKLYQEIITGRFIEFRNYNHFDNIDFYIKEFLNMYNQRDKTKVKQLIPDNLELSLNTKIVDFKETKPREKQEKKTKPKRKINYVEQLKTQMKVGLKGEIIALNYEIEKLKDQPKLIENIEKCFEIDDSAGYDIKSFDEQGNIIYIEVKTNSSNNSDNHITFYISPNEDEFINNHENAYIYYVCNLKEPKIYIINQEQYKKMRKDVSQYKIDVDCY